MTIPPTNTATQFDHASNVQISNSRVSATANNYYDTSGTYGKFIHLQAGFAPSTKRAYLGLEILLGKIAEGADVDCLHAFERPRCHEETRKAVLAAITSWADGSPDRINGVLWLHGPAGAGKSAIVQTFSERLRDRKKLAASFFFSRLASRRDSAEYFFATIAHQLTLSIPGIRDLIVKAVERNPTIFSSSLTTQMKTLIIGPLHDLGTDIQLEANVVAIDGLDECRGESFQCEILQVIGDALLRHNLPLYFLVASRPELHLQTKFFLASISNIYTVLELNRQFKPDEDIKLYLECSLRILMGRPQNRLIFSEALQFKTAIDILVERSSGQFIYPSTVLKFIEDPTESPTDRLNIVLGTSPPSADDHPLAPLDALYIHILSNTKKDKHRMRAKTVLGAIIVLQSNLRSPRALDYCLSAISGFASLALSHLHSVVYVPDANSDKDVSFYHATFSEFLLDPTRSTPQYFISETQAYEDLAHRYLQRWGHCNDTGMWIKLVTWKIQ